jgi:hypothetical protein
MISTQELENIDIQIYKDKPEELIAIAKKLLNIKKFEKGIELSENAIRFIIEKTGTETHIDCAKFYYYYADALIRKCMESDELLAINEAQQKEEPKSNIDVVLAEKLEKNKVNDRNEDENEDGDDEPRNDNDSESREEIEPIQDVSDEEVASENLLVAENIYKSYLSNYDDKEPSEISEKFPEIKKLYFELSNVYQKLGELEMCKSDFKCAIDFFTNALNLRKKYDDKFSRATAELYFNMATAFDFDAKKCLMSFYKTKIIMEYHLKQELKKHNFSKTSDKIKVFEEDLDLESVTTDHKNINANTEVMNSDEIHNELVVKIEDLLELVGIILELNQKIEDVIIDIKDFEKYSKEKEELKQEAKFTEDYDKSKVVEVNNTLIRKRPRKEENTEIEREEGGKKHKSEDLN